MLPGWVERAPDHPQAFRDPQVRAYQSENGLAWLARRQAQLVPVILKVTPFVGALRKRHESAQDCGRAHRFQVGYNAKVFFPNGDALQLNTNEVVIGLAALHYLEGLPADSCDPARHGRALGNNEAIVLLYVGCDAKSNGGISR